MEAECPSTGQTVFYELQLLYKSTFATLNVLAYVWYVYSYSVMQSYANSFRGDVVLGTFNNVSRDEDNILNQIYIRQICSDFIMRISNLKSG